MSGNRMHHMWPGMNPAARGLRIAGMVLMGVIGSVFTGYLGRGLDWWERTPVTGEGVVVCAIGAIVTVAIFGLAVHQRLHVEEPSTHHHAWR